jgi:hypothetical protein
MAITLRRLTTGVKALIAEELPHLRRGLAQLEWLSQEEVEYRGGAPHIPFTVLIEYLAKIIQLCEGAAGAAECDWREIGPLLIAHLEMARPLTLKLSDCLKRALLPSTQHMILRSDVTLAGGALKRLHNLIIHQ